ncbi:beta-1,3-galactosyltransferase 5-like [Paramuricea clavata]|uniref:Hexosyltransferase n=1 Tax=Paramuricea clavata TaxID=317549 RepID=A0A7D9LJJ4_PARCT|nr:beta-1,3-galactosyltransferase 5-like [Paramuricea clavata]
MFSVIKNAMRRSTIIFNIARVATRSYRRFLVVLLVLFLVFYISSSLYTFVVDFYIPTMQPEPIRKDMSKMAIIEDQVNFIPSIIKPEVITDKLFVLVLINSAAGSETHYRKRMAIRNTWGKPIGRNQWKITFFLGRTGKPLIDENRLMEAKKYGDIIIGDFPDTYRNITQKLMMAFKWASEQNYEYLLKTDDDVYINVPLLINWINEQSEPGRALFAGVLYRAYVIRDPSHRHFVSWNDLQQKRYPWYPKGALYVLSSGVVRGMVEITNRVKMITVDDAYVGVLASYLGVKPVRLHGFIQWGFLPNLIELFDVCTYLNIIGMADNLTPDDIYFVHQEVTLLRDSSKWMCVHIYHPILVTVGFLIFIIVILYKCRRNIF